MQLISLFLSFSLASSINSFLLLFSYSYCASLLLLKKPILYLRFNIFFASLQNMINKLLGDSESQDEFQCFIFRTKIQNSFFCFFTLVYFLVHLTFKISREKGGQERKILNFILFIFKILNPKNFFPKDCDNNTSYT